jgi:hypothetical protein
LSGKSCQTATFENPYSLIASPFAEQVNQWFARVAPVSYQCQGVSWKMASFAFELFTCAALERDVPVKKPRGGF